MKICHLMYDDIANPWLGGGGAVRALELYRRLSSRHEITVVSGLFPGAEPETEQHGLRLLRVGSARSYALSRLGYCRAALAELQRLEWDLWINEFSAFAPLRVPAALRQQGLLLFYHFMGLHALAKHPLVGGVAWLCEQRALRAWPRILTIAPSVQARIERRAPRAAVDLVYSGVDRRFFALAPEEAPYLLYFGRMDIHTKGIDLLIAAFAEIATEHKDIHLKLAGRGTPEQLAARPRFGAASGIGGPRGGCRECGRGAKRCALASRPHGLHPVPLRGLVHGGRRSRRGRQSRAGHQHRRPARRRAPRRDRGVGPP